MREILNSGVTGILVSHATSQIRELCNKVLWLDHGNQICFTNEVDLYVNAYEDFLINKQLPKNYDDVQMMSERYLKNVDLEMQKKKAKEISRLEEILENRNENAVEAAVNIIRKKRPELLKKSALKEL